MNDQDKPRSWWYTLPGVVTGAAAIITAVTGLVVAIKQTGWFDSDAPQKPTAVATATASRPPPAAPSSTPPAAPASTKSAYPVALPDLRDYKLGGVTYTLLTAEMSRQTTEKDALKIRVRMMNPGRADTNFWGSSFRLFVNEVPMAPENFLNELVRSESAKEGEVIFVIPHGTSEVRLRISFADDSTVIPLPLGSPR